MSVLPVQSFIIYQGQCSETEQEIFAGGVDLMQPDFPFSDIPVLWLDDDEEYV